MRTHLSAVSALWATQPPTNNTHQTLSKQTQTRETRSLDHHHIAVNADVLRLMSFSRNRQGWTGSTVWPECNTCEDWCSLLKDTKLLVLNEVKLRREFKFQMFCQLQTWIWAQSRSQDSCGSRSLTWNYVEQWWNFLNSSTLQEI